MKEAIVNNTEFENFLEVARKEHGDSITRQQVKALCSKHSIKFPNQFLNDPKVKLARGVYNLKNFSDTNKVMIKETTNKEAFINMTTAQEELVPQKDPLYVKFGNYDEISQVISSRSFYPIFVTGLSGNGKTFMIEQACAENRREFFRVNVTIETDEDDLLGGTCLVNDCTKWFDGPVVRAMKAGGVLLLDEVDLASTKIMCLQPILEGKGILLKKINQYVKPEPGFTVIATANTKGQGSDSGKFVGTMIMNEAFLERFPVTFEQSYPTPAVEKKILNKVFKSKEIDSGNFSDMLVDWAELNRKAFYNGIDSEVITTRRLVHIANAYSIFNDRRRSIELCLNRFDEETKKSLIKLYENMDESILPEEKQKEIIAAREAKARAAAVPVESKSISEIFGTNT